jgi:TPR repeat protein
MVLLLIAAAWSPPERGAEMGRRAVQEIRAKAEDGDAQAQLELGISHASGDDVGKDPVEAAKWFRKAAEQGNAQAQYNLRACYQDDDGVGRDCIQVHQWYSLAVAKPGPAAGRTASATWQEGRNSGRSEQGRRLGARVPTIPERPASFRVYQPQRWEKRSAH